MSVHGLEFEVFGALLSTPGMRVEFEERCFFQH